MKPIVLIGLPGAGKTSVGEILANLMNIAFYDSDRLIEEKEQRTVAKIFAEDGEKRFRDLETALISEFDSKACVFSCGGGLPMTPGNMDTLLKLGRVVYLKTAVDELVNRLEETHDRPLLSSDNEHVLRNRLRALETERTVVYERAELTVQTDGLSTDEVAQEILQKVQG